MKTKKQLEELGFLFITLPGGKTVCTLRDRNNLDKCLFRATAKTMLTLRKLATNYLIS